MVKTIQINLSNKVFYTLVAVSVIIVLSWVVFAYGTNDPAVFGHSAGEIEEADPTVIVSVKDGVSWDEVDWNGSTGFADGVDDTGSATTEITAGRKVLGDGAQISQTFYGGYYGQATPYARVVGTEIQVRVVGCWGTCGCCDTGWRNAYSASCTVCVSPRTSTATLQWYGVQVTGGNGQGSVYW